MRPSGSLVTRLIRSRPLMQAARDSPGVQELAQQWFAGELITDAVFLAAKLRRQGLSLSFHHLPASDELNTAAQLSHLLEALGPDAKGVELSVKPSTIGLRESAVLAEDTLRGLTTTADDHGAVVTLEMQRPEEYQPTLDLFRAVRADHESCGITIPANFRRAEADCRDLAREGARVRVCVGSYPAPHTVAISGEHNKSRALVRCLRILMESSAHPLVATHDPRIIAIALAGVLGALVATSAHADTDEDTYIDAEITQTMIEASTIDLDARAATVDLDASGSRIERNIRHQLAPSMYAASSSSTGTAATKPRSIQMPKARESAT